VNPKRTPGTGKSGLTLMLNLLTEQKETKKKIGKQTTSKAEKPHG